MKHISLSVAAAAMVLSTPAWAGVQDFVLVNRTGYEIREVYVSPTTEDSWEEDVMGRDTLPDGDRVTIRFDRDEDRCRYDIKLVDIDGDETEWENINLCSVSVVSVRYDRLGTPIADLE